MDPEGRASCAVMAAVLARGRIVNGLSWPITAATFVAAPLINMERNTAWGFAALAIAFAAGLAQAFFAARVALDADLFRALGAGSLDLAGLDAAMKRLKLVSPAKLGRPLEQRFEGAARLFEAQIAALALQFVLALGFFVLLRRM